MKHFNPTLVQFKRIARDEVSFFTILFQSYISPIQTTVPSAYIEGSIIFQSYISPIQTTV